MPTNRSGAPDDADFDRLRILTAEDILETLSDENAQWFIDDDWSSVEYWIPYETEVISRLDRAAADEDEWNDLAADISWTDEVPWPVNVGTASAVAALNAAGCPTLWSRRGDGRDPSEVGCSAGPERARLVVAAAAAAECRAAVDPEGWLVVTAERRENMIELARQLLLWREELDGIPPPPTHALLDDSGSWREDLDQLRGILEEGIDDEDLPVDP